MNQTIRIFGCAIPILLAQVFPGRAASVTVQAEFGNLGANFVVGNDGGTQFISNTNNNTGNNPGVDSRVASYSVTFPEASSYSLYARIRVGAVPDGPSNDSCFMAMVSAPKRSR